MLCTKLENTAVEGFFFILVQMFLKSIEQEGHMAWSCDHWSVLADAIICLHEEAWKLYQGRMCKYMF